MLTSFTEVLHRAAGDAVPLRALVMGHVFRLRECLQPDTEESVRHEREQADEADRSVAALRALSAEECARRAVADYERGLAIVAELAAEDVARQRRFVRAKALIEGWAVPPVLEEFRARLLAELTEDWPEPCRTRPRAQRDGEAWRADEIAFQERNAAFYREKIVERQTADRKNKEWAEALLAAFAAHEAQADVPPATQPEGR